MPLHTRAPTFPLECFHGNSHAEKVEVVRDEGKDIIGLKVDLMMDGTLDGCACVVHVLCVMCT